jgi:2,4-dienoyl-CoA reductase-like NADH-dependent reductase (Old Yellow Enzyme family)
MPADFGDPLKLPCGAMLPNRLLKSAMTEGLATPDGRATGRLNTLYRRWSQGGAGTVVPTTGVATWPHGHVFCWRR